MPQAAVDRYADSHAINGIGKAQQGSILFALSSGEIGCSAAAMTDEDCSHLLIKTWSGGKYVYLVRYNR
jgi:hypothetical protein